MKHKNSKTKETYYQFSKKLLSSEYIVIEGVTHKLDIYDKTVYTRMRDQFVWRYEEDLSYYESVAQIAAKCCFSDSKVKRSISKLRDSGLIKEIGRHRRAIVWKVLDLSDLDVVFSVDLSTKVENKEPKYSTLKVEDLDVKVEVEDPTLNDWLVTGEGLPF